MATDLIGLPRPLVQRVNELAAKEGLTPEELVREAVETRLGHAEWLQTLDFGDSNARRRRLKPDDVDTEIAAVRAEQTR